VPGAGGRLPQPARVQQVGQVERRPGLLPGLLIPLFPGGGVDGDREPGGAGAGEGARAGQHQGVPLGSDLGRQPLQADIVYLQRPDLVLRHLTGRELERGRARLEEQGGGEEEGEEEAGGQHHHYVRGPGPGLPPWPPTSG
jgi:hypothetical protein